jgi:hypothetical protein
MTPAIVNHALYPKLILSGKAELTIKRQDGKHVKLKFKQRKDRKSGKMTPCYFVYMALLSDGDLSYKYVAAFFSDSFGIKLGNDVSQTSREARILRFFVDAIRNPQMLVGTEVQHSGKCCCCKQKLTHPWSLNVGLGPKCFQDVFGMPNNDEARVLLSLGLLDARSEQYKHIATNAIVE